MNVFRIITLIGIAYMIKKAKSYRDYMNSLKNKIKNGDNLTDAEQATYDKWKLSSATTKFKSSSFLWIGIAIGTQVTISNILLLSKVKKLSVEEVDGIYNTYAYYFSWMI